MSRYSHFGTTTRTPRTRRECASDELHTRVRLSMDVPADVREWAVHTLRALQSGIHARLIGKMFADDIPSPAPSDLDDTRDVFIHLGVLLTECNDLLDFERAESITKRGDELCSSARDENSAFNYALATQAVHSLQAELHTLRGETDPDATFVDSHVPWQSSSDWCGLAQDTIQSMNERHASELAHIYEQHADELEALRNEHATDMEHVSAQHASDIRTMEDRYIKTIEHAAQDRAGEAERHKLECLERETQYSAELKQRQQSWDEREASLTAKLEEMHRTWDKREAEHKTELEHVQHMWHERDVQRATDFEKIQRTWEVASEALGVTLDSLQHAVASQGSRLAPLHGRIQSLNRLLDTFAQERDAANAEALAWSERHAEAQAHIAALQVEITSKNTDLVQQTSRLVETERKLKEVQNEIECSAHVQANIDELQERLSVADHDAWQLREQLRSLEPLRTERAQLSSEVHELQKLVSMYKDSVAHAQHEHEQTQQQLERTETQRFAIEQALREREMELRDLYEAKRIWTEQRRAFKARPSVSNEATQRVAELEIELSAKATEVEEADTRLLTVMKENKRLAAQLKSLKMDTKRALQDVTNATSKTYSPTKADARVARYRPVS